MNYLKVRPDGAAAAPTQKVSITDGSITINDDGGSCVEVSNATHHVEAFTRKANTILIEMNATPKRAGQNGGASADPTMQITLDDVNYVLGIMRANQRLVTKDAMHQAIVTFETDVRVHHVEHELMTLGAAFKTAGLALRTFLSLKHTPSVASDPTGKAAGLPDASTSDANTSE